METVYLSERNLRTLLSKIDRLKTGDSTECTLIKYSVPTDPYVQSMDSVMVVAIPDNLYYTNRLAGKVHPLDEPK